MERVNFTQQEDRGRFDSDLILGKCLIKGFLNGYLVSVLSGLENPLGGAMAGLMFEFFGPVNAAENEDIQKHFLGIGVMGTLAGRISILQAINAYFFYQIDPLLITKKAGLSFLTLARGDTIAKQTLIQSVRSFIQGTLLGVVCGFLISQSDQELNLLLLNKEIDTSTAIILGAFCGLISSLSKEIFKKFVDTNQRRSFIEFANIFNASIIWPLISARAAGWEIESVNGILLLCQINAVSEILSSI